MKGNCFIDIDGVCLQLTELHMRYKYHPMNPNKNILSANQFFSLIDMKRKFINSDNHKFLNLSRRGRYMHKHLIHHLSIGV
jgi:hypothetical protein